jgi:Ca2+-binding RTX toxin-like protein
MPSIRTERVPVRTFNLGLFGFDHLQLVFQHDDTPLGAIQDGWFVMEGLREAGPDGAALAVEGAQGDTTLSMANGGAEGAVLVERIGTPELRGSRQVPAIGGEGLAWATMAAFAGDIDSQAFPYIALSLPGSPVPTINSSSLASSLLYYIGVDISSYMPFGTRLAPGTTTLLGSSGNDDLTVTASFTTILGGEGSDTLRGSDDGRVDRLYGGKEDDSLEWSDGFNILHGGQPGLAYDEDGIDTVGYVGAGVVRIDANPYAVPHYRPDFIATRATGTDHLYSIERLEWDETTDHIVLGNGVTLTEEDLTLKLGLEDGAGSGDRIDFSGLEGDGLLVNAADFDLLFVSRAASEGGHGLWIEEAEWIVGSPGADRIYAAPLVHGIEGGAGADLLDARFALPFTGGAPQGYDIEIDGGAGDDTIVAGAGRTLAVGGAGADRFVLSSMTFGAELVEFVIADAGAEDRVYAPYDFFNLTFGDAEGSPLFPLLGAMAQEAGHASFADLPENLGPWLGGPPARSDFFAFEWQLEEDLLFGSDETAGVITFAGAILYNREGSDLLIHLFLGFPQEVTEPGSNELPWTHIVNTFLPGTEAIIRVTDFDEGDLGIVFHDPGEGVPIDIETDHGPYGAIHYPGWDAAVLAMTNGGAVAPALDPRPLAPDYDPEDQGPGDDETVVAGTGADDTIVLAAAADTTVEAGGGNDTVETGSGDDRLDGGAGVDTLTGGVGNDLYIVDSEGDTVVETEHGGTDEVRASVSFTLPEFVENLTLVGGGGESVSALAETSASGTGNALANRLVGNEASNTLAGLGGNDTLLGGMGSDALDGGNGSDGYVYIAGDGDDVIVDTGPAGDRDVLVLGGLAPADVSFHRLAGAPDDLVLTFAVGGRVLIRDFAAAPGTGIDAVTFDDGTVWERTSLEAFAAMAPVLDGDPPQAEDDFDLVAVGSSVVIPWEALTANDRDFDGDPLSIVEVANVSGGATVTIEPEISLRLLTPSGFAGLVTFDYRISDGAGGEAWATAEIAVVPGEPANTAPVAGDDAGFETTVGVPLEISAAELTANDQDADGHPLEIVSVQNGGHGTAALSGGVVLFTPEPGYSGPASFSYTVSDGRGGTATAAVSITIAAPAANVITGTNGGETLTGTPGADYIDGRGADDTLVGRGGDDIFRVAGERSGFGAYQGGAGFDRIQGSARNDVIAIATLAGIEAIDGGEGSDVVRLTAGDDRLSLANVEVTSIETIDAGAGNDTVIGSEGADRILGGPGDDRLSGLGGDDVFLVEGMGGFDVFRGGEGTDRIEGSAGDDVIGLADTSGHLAGIEIIDAGAGHDVIRLTGGNDRLDLTALSVTGVEVIEAGAGNDTVTGSAGADRIDGGSGNDRLTGGAGDDVFAVAGTDTGFDVMKGGEGTDRIQGSAGDDVIGLADVASNLSGIEIIDGGQGFDAIRLTEGNDRLDLSAIGVFGIEAIEAGAGDDRIVASAADDVISGGAGRDTFIFRPGFGHDVIADFETGDAANPDGDLIDVRALGYRNLAEILADATETAAGTLITADDGSTLTVANVALGQLEADDFRFA